MQFIDDVYTAQCPNSLEILRMINPPHLKYTVTSYTDDKKLYMLFSRSGVLGGSLWEDALQNCF
jgi:hypothetical protein